MTHDQYMELAIKLAEQSVEKHTGCPCGALIVKDGKIIAKANCEVFQKHNPLRHAEMVAIEKALKKLSATDLQNCDLYTSSEPCPMCFAAIYWTKMKTVYYANTISTAAKYGLDDKFIYAEAAKPPAIRTIPFIHLSEHDATEPFKHWTKKDF